MYAAESSQMIIGLNRLKAVLHVATDELEAIQIGPKGRAITRSKVTTQTKRLAVALSNKIFGYLAEFQTRLREIKLKAKAAVQCLADFSDRSNIAPSKMQYLVTRRYVYKLRLAIKSRRWRYRTHRRKPEDKSIEK
ncbi:hypothetical protein APZ15_27375 [Burkholderia cepacia ATCC 25416]|nr:hypothetical protein APZ15_27375 [Burkholderia cepacia ATCC 25416]